VGVSFLRGGRRVLPIALTMGAAIAALAGSAIVFDRYGLVVMPGLSLLAALGWEAGLSARSHRVRAVVTGASLIAFMATSGALVRSQVIAGETDVSVLATDWIVANIRPGARVARHDEDNTYLPRTREQLDSCINGISSRQTYAEKLQVIGMPERLAVNEPMRGAVLNDELFQAYWCRRERAVAAASGFTLIPYHPQPRFGSVLEEDAIDSFRARLTGAAAAGPDVLVTSHPVDAGIAPAATFQTSRGERIIYARPEARR
jgi:hypothetical protein